MTNDGGGYSGHTGVFTAPVTGMYVFFVNQLTIHGKTLESLIVHNGIPIANIYSGDDKYYSSGSNMAVIQLNLGDEVGVKVHDSFHDSGPIIDGPWTTFSGYKLY